MTEEEYRSGKDAKGDPIPHGPFDYMAAADKTNSVLFHPDYVDRDAFVRNLRSFIETAEVINLYKKLLFRGRTPEDLNMPHPRLHASLAPEFDPNNTEEATINVVHGCVGVITEAGEVAEILLNAIEQNKLDPVNVAEEAGDLRWYIVRMLRGIGMTDEQCERMNIDKLHGRHGETFNVERDANRNLMAERKGLEAAAAPLLDREPTGEMAEMVDRIAGSNVGMVKPIPPGGVRG